jgi:16S rRNA (cytosine1402-N4)-methyltransferase
VHIPVLLDKVVNFLEPLEGKTILDATVGAAGHAEAILKRLGPTGKYIGLDQDADALKLAEKRLSPYKRQVLLFQNNFVFMKETVFNAGIFAVDGILMDLGLSSLQLEDPSRGFSFQHEGELDMRMDRRRQLTAKALVNSLNEKELGGLLWEYGEERFAKRIAAAIVHYRKKSPINTTKELAEIVEKSIPRKAWPHRIHPATRTFQALRIAVNGELDALKEGLHQAVELLNPLGRLLVISYHSLEDRIVKQFFRTLNTSFWRILTKKPVVPEAGEIQNNPRARSAKLRVLERVA